LDFALPKRFELEYTGEDGQKHTPIMLHRVVYGSMERFLWILIEHFAWAFPLWLAPKQIMIVPVAETFEEYANQIKWELKWQWIRVFVDESENTFSKKIRNAEIEKIPYIIIVGEKEETNKMLSIREYKTKKQYESGVTEFVNICLDNIKNRSV
jgi:threonyl-tRNA synthetase